MLGHGHERVQGEGLVPGQGLERRGAGAVADQAAGCDAGGGGGDLAVGYAQQHDVGAGAVGPAAERALHRDARLAQACRPARARGARVRRSLLKTRRASVVVHPRNE